MRSLAGHPAFFGFWGGNRVLTYQQLLTEAPPLLRASLWDSRGLFYLFHVVPKGKPPGQIGQTQGTSGMS